jgi:hypothetical protein
LIWLQKGAKISKIIKFQDCKFQCATMNKNRNSHFLRIHNPDKLEKTVEIWEKQGKMNIQTFKGRYRKT